jgi:DnaJ-class molecular chaperone
MRQRDAGKTFKKCEECDGTGEVEVEYVRGSGPNADLAYRLDVCEECFGRGEVECDDENED